MSRAALEITTARLTLRELDARDTDFIVELLNDPDFIRYIGDRGVRDAVGAQAYLDKGPIASYAQHGFGLWRVGLTLKDTPIGICGLLKRDVLPEPDLGFAFLPQYRGNGFGSEAAAATLQWGWRHQAMAQVLAITSPDNQDSIRLLHRQGFHFERMLKLQDDAGEVRLFALPRPTALA